MLGVIWRDPAIGNAAALRKARHIRLGGFRLGDLDRLGPRVALDHLAHGIVARGFEAYHAGDCPAGRFQRHVPGLDSIPGRPRRRPKLRPKTQRKTQHKNRPLDFCTMRKD